MSDIDRLVNIVLSGSLTRQPFDSVAHWFVGFNVQTRQFDQSIERAILGGRLSPNVSFAFTSAYQSAIEYLFQPKDIELASFCVTEKKGNHPKAIETSLSIESGQVKLSGKKQFVSGANDAQRLYIACLDRRENSHQDAEGRPKIVMVSVPATEAGVNIEKMPALGFVPEVSHGKLYLDQVRITPEQILDGDGYLNYVKAFRTVEDMHVLASLVAYRLGEAVEGDWPQRFLEGHVSLLLALHSLSQMNLNLPAAHIALAACRASFHELINQTDSFFETSQPDAFSSWCRDRVLLNVAKDAHLTRTERAWQDFRR